MNFSYGTYRGDTNHTRTHFCHALCTRHGGNVSYHITFMIQFHVVPRHTRGTIPYPTTLHSWYNFLCYYTAFIVRFHIPPHHTHRTIPYPIGVPSCLKMVPRTQQQNETANPEEVVSAMRKALEGRQGDLDTTKAACAQMDKEIG